MLSGMINNGAVLALLTTLAGIVAPLITAVLTNAATPGWVKRLAALILGAIGGGVAAKVPGGSPGLGTVAGLWTVIAGAILPSVAYRALPWRDWLKRLIPSFGIAARKP